jgi:bifunctional DNA-binding transcriptional regulator/antitoxin component of YhaV-PrlF toxin-antitoxin module
MRQEKPLSKLVRPLSRGQITLPVEFRRRLKIDAETILSVTLKADRVDIVPLRPRPEAEAVRDFSQDEIERFLKEDRIDRATAAKVRRLLGRKHPA